MASGECAQKGTLPSVSTLPERFNETAKAPCHEAFAPTGVPPQVSIVPLRIDASMPFASSMSNANSFQSLLVKLVEAVRIFGTGAGYYVVYDAYGAGDEVQALRLLMLTIAIGMCATCAVEGLFLSSATAAEKGYDGGNDKVSPYQLQNSMWFVAATVVGVGWFFFDATARGAFLNYTVLISLFFTLSACNHAFQAIRHQNLTWQNLNRPVLQALMLGAGLPIILANF